MRKAVTVAIVLGATLAASASVQIFFTDSTYGLNWPSFAFEPVWPQAEEWPVVNQFPPEMAPVTVAAGDTIYIWFKFNDEPNSRKVNALNLDLTGPSEPTQVAYYTLYRNATETGRWDGGNWAWPFQQDPVTLVATLNGGLKNLSGANAGWLYSGAPLRTYLLGAVRYDVPGVYSAQLGTLGINYSGGYPPPDMEFGTVTVTPLVPPICRGDADCDGQVDFADIDYFVAAIPDNEAAWAALYAANHGAMVPPCAFANNDIDGSGHVDFGDIDPFVGLIPSACP